MAQTKLSLKKTYRNWHVNISPALQLYRKAKYYYSEFTNSSSTVYSLLNEAAELLERYSSDNLVARYWLAKVRILHWKARNLTAREGEPPLESLSLLEDLAKNYNDQLSTKAAAQLCIVYSKHRELCSNPNMKLACALRAFAGDSKYASFFLIGSGQLFGDIADMSNIKELNTRLFFSAHTKKHYNGTIIHCAKNKVIINTTVAKEMYKKIFVNGDKSLMFNDPVAFIKQAFQKISLSICSNPADSILLSTTLFTELGSAATMHGSIDSLEQTCKTLQSGTCDLFSPLQLKTTNPTPKIIPEFLISCSLTSSKHAFAAYSCCLSPVFCNTMSNVLKVQLLLNGIFSKRKSCTCWEECLDAIINNGFNHGSFLAGSEYKELREKLSKICSAPLLPTHEEELKLKEELYAAFDAFKLASSKDSSLNPSL